MRRIAVVLCLLLPSCGSIKVLSDLPLDDQAAIVCAGYGATLRTLTVLKSDMTPAQVKIVDQTVKVVPPLCAAALQDGLVSEAMLQAILAGTQDLLLVNKAMMP